MLENHRLVAGADIGRYRNVSRLSFLCVLVARHVSGSAAPPSFSPSFAYSFSLSPPVSIISTISTPSFHASEVVGLRRRQRRLRCIGPRSGLPLLNAANEGNQGAATFDGRNVTILPADPMSLSDVISSDCVSAHHVKICQIDNDFDNIDNNNNNDNADADSSNGGGGLSALTSRILSSYLGPRLVLALAACLYGTNFSLGAMMNDALPASAATSGRMVLAAIVLSPFLTRLKPSLRTDVLVCGTLVSMGYVAQSLALVDTDPAVVSFLGATAVLVCPLLEWAVDKKPAGWRDAPQTWMAAALCLAGVASLELAGGRGEGGALELAFGVGDALSLLQAVGFGAGIFLSEKMMRKEPDQALPVTAALIATTAFYCMIWCLADGWMMTPTDLGVDDARTWQSMGLPGLFLDPSMRMVALAVAWTGIVSTSMNFFLEITALGRVPSAEASVILATEPLWAGLFAALLFHEQFGMNDIVGGALMISACLVNAIKPKDFWVFVLRDDGSNDNEEDDLLAS